MMQGLPINVAPWHACSQKKSVILLEGSRAEGMILDASLGYPPKLDFTLE